MKTKANANFYSLGGSSVHDGKGEPYAEYRRCWMEYPAKYTLRDFPMHLDLEVTSRCNLRCTFCDKLPQLSSGQLGDMDIALYKKIIDEGSRHGLWGAKLSYRGEPLLHKNIVEMISYAKERGVLDSYFNTNGMLLTRSMSERLIDAGLDRISVSVEGTDPIEYEKQRVGARFKTLVENIDALMEARKRKGSDHPKVRVQTVFLPGMDLDGYKRFWLSHCDEVAAVDYKDGALLDYGLAGEWGCPQLWQRMTVQWDGAVSPCNNDDRCLFIVGNLNKRSVYDCWHDKKVEAARALHKQGRSHGVNACNGCPWRTAQIKKGNSR